MTPKRILRRTTPKKAHENDKDKKLRDKLASPVVDEEFADAHIAAETAAIQAGWTETEKARRNQRPAQGFEFPDISTNLIWRDRYE